MHVKHVLATCFLVQVVHILGAEGQACSDLSFKIHQCSMGRIWLTRCSIAPTHRVELPHERWIATPTLRRGDVFNTVSAPQTVGIAKRGYAALGTDARTG